MLRGIAAASAALMLLGAAPAPRLDPVPPGAQTALVRTYLDALVAGKYSDAYALLEAPARAYFRNAENYRSVFAADDLHVVSYALTGARGNARFRLYFAKERLRLRDPSRDAIGSSTVTVPYGVAGSGAAARIKDLGHPWRAYASSATATANGLRVSVKKVSYYARAVAVVVTFANVGDGFVTLLPYGRSVLRDASGTIARPIANRTWTQTDKQLFLGVRLAAGAQVTGVLSFATPHVDDRARSFTLSVGPNVRAGADQPFSVDIAPIGAPA